jgi:hypothetical protein
MGQQCNDFKAAATYSGKLPLFSVRKSALSQTNWAKFKLILWSKIEFILPVDKIFITCERVSNPGTMA